MPRFRPVDNKFVRPINNISVTIARHSSNSVFRCSRESTIPVPGGAVATLMMGIGGSVIGCGCTLFFWEGARITPISVVGFFAGTVGAFVILFFYKLLSGTYFAESEDGEGSG